jgi:hypothetical protein
MHIKPNAGILVPDYKTRRIVGPEGIEVDAGDLFWHRLVLDGDFTVVTEPESSVAHVDAKDTK